MPITMVRLCLHGCSESELQKSLPLIQPMIQLVDLRFVSGLRDGALQLFRLRRQDDLETGPSVQLMPFLIGHLGRITAIYQLESGKGLTTPCPRPRPRFPRN